MCISKPIPLQLVRATARNGREVAPRPVKEESETSSYIKVLQTNIGSQYAPRRRVSYGSITGQVLGQYGDGTPVAALGEDKSNIEADNARS